MSKIGTRAAEAAAQVEQGHASAPSSALSEEDRSKDAFFTQVAEVAEAMIARHGKDFAMGTLVLSAKFIAEGKPLITESIGGSRTDNMIKPV
jgi:hypothetical protein